MIYSPKTHHVCTFRYRCGFLSERDSYCFISDNVTSRNMYTNVCTYSPHYPIHKFPEQTVVMTWILYWLIYNVCTYSPYYLIHKFPEQTVIMIWILHWLIYQDCLQHRASLASTTGAGFISTTGESCSTIFHTCATANTQTTMVTLLLTGY